jgi:hypothetical protein
VRASRCSATRWTRRCTAQPRRTSNECATCAWRRLSGASPPPHRTPYGAMNKVANRSGRVGHGADRNGPLNEGQISQNCRGVRVSLGAGFDRVEGNRRASRDGPVSDLPPEIPNVRFVTFSIAVRGWTCGSGRVSGARPHALLLAAPNLVASHSRSSMIDSLASSTYPYRRCPPTAHGGSAAASRLNSSLHRPGVMYSSPVQTVP